MIRTERLILRDVTEADVEALAGYCAEPESQEHMLARQRLPTHEPWLRTAAAVARLVPWERRAGLLLAVERSADALVLGLCTLSTASTGATATLGWHFGSAHAGAGYATEAAQAMLRHAFVGCGAVRVVGDCFGENAAAKQVFAKLGMHEEARGPLRRWWLRRSYGEKRTILRHAIASDQWAVFFAHATGAPPCAS